MRIQKQKNAMKSGYKILWTDNALRELEATIAYLEENWTDKELHNLALNIEKTLSLIAQNPYIYKASDVKKRFVWLSFYL